MKPYHRWLYAYGAVAALILMLLAASLVLGFFSRAHAADVVFTIPTQSADTLNPCGRTVPGLAKVKYVQVQWRDTPTATNPEGWRMLQFWAVPVAGSRDGRQVRIRSFRADTALIRARAADSLMNWSCWMYARRQVPVTLPAIKDLKVEP